MLHCIIKPVAGPAAPSPAALAFRCAIPMPRRARFAVMPPALWWRVWHSDAWCGAIGRPLTRACCLSGASMRSMVRCDCAPGPAHRGLAYPAGWGEINWNESERNKAFPRAQR